MDGTVLIHFIIMTALSRLGRFFSFLHVAFSYFSSHFLFLVFFFLLLFFFFFFILSVSKSLCAVITRENAADRGE